MEPISTGGSGLLIGKFLTAFAGLIGGLSLSVFWQPEKIRAHGKLAAGAIVGGISVGGSFTLGGLVANQLGLDMTNMDISLGVGFVMGLVCIGIINFLANFFDRREKSDILEVATEMRGAAARLKAPQSSPRAALKSAAGSKRGGR